MLNVFVCMAITEMEKTIVMVILEKKIGKELVNLKKECGLTYFQQNATLNPGRAVPYSWPATTHIQFVYTDFERLGNFSTAVSYSGICAGVLINRRTGNFIMENSYYPLKSPLISRNYFAY